MTHDEYCMNVCGGKCCKLWYHEEKEERERCPNLDRENKCMIHTKWVNGYCGQTKDRIGFNTMPIRELLRNKLLPQWIVDQCCYEHPELLN